ncbi:hypothetical protein OH77DRAFT_1435753 [Trametes cingulata]|nr:hypothetical protein OH77DRAFT_1435753 [Trametes cingulata]
MNPSPHDENRTARHRAQTVPVIASSRAVHPCGFDIYEVTDFVRGNIGIGDLLDLAYGAKDGSVIYLPVRVSRVRVLESKSVEFVANKRGPHDIILPETVLLHVSRKMARLGRWPSWNFIRSRPWTLAVIPEIFVGIPRFTHATGRRSLSVRRFLHEQPDARRTSELIKSIICETTVVTTQADDTQHSRL